MRSAFVLALSLCVRIACAADVAGLVVDTQGRPVKDAVIFVSGDLGEAVQTPEKPYVMDQRGKEFIPRLLPIVVGSKVRFPNADDIHHHVYSFSPTKTFELPLYKGEPAGPVDFPKLGAVALGCNIHDWMRGVILVLPNAHFAKTDKDGRALLTGLPEDREALFYVFHEALSEPVEATRLTLDLRASQAPLQARWTLPLKPPKPRPRLALDYR